MTHSTNSSSSLSVTAPRGLPAGSGTAGWLTFLDALSSLASMTYMIFILSFIMLWNSLYENYLVCLLHVLSLREDHKLLLCLTFNIKILQRKSISEMCAMDV